MRKAADAFRSIGEVSQLVGVPPHVLRYWETQFPQLAPVKRADGRRYYRPEDLHLAAGLCELLREEGMTTRGAARIIAKDKGATLRARGLARLPERFRGEAAGPDTGSAEAQDPSPTEPAMTDTTPAPDATDAGTEDTSAPPPEQGGGASADQGVAGAPEPAPTDAAAQPASAAEARPQGEREATGMATAPDAATGEPEAMATGAEVAAADKPGAPAAMPATEAQPPIPAQPIAGPTTQRPAARQAADLPLFPGLAPAAPPPGVWLPRLAATADALRGLTPPRRPTAQMLRLRDRLAALIDAGA